MKDSYLFGYSLVSNQINIQYRAVVFRGGFFLAYVRKEIALKTFHMLMCS